MIDVDLLLAFTTGMVVTVNPCGFAMLPAYLGFFLGAETGADDVTEPAARSVRRGLVVGACVTVGFVSAFGAVGLIVNLLSDQAYDVAPWLSVAIGVGLVLFGVSLLLGFQPNLRLPHLERGGRDTSLSSMTLFGVSYAVASVGCALPTFVSYTSLNFGRGFVSGATYFLAYTLGFGLVLTSLSVALALGKHSLLTHLRRLLPFMNRIAGALLVATGVYVAYYGIVEIRLNSQGTVGGSPVLDRVTEWSSGVTNWINDVGADRLGLALGFFLLATAALAGAVRRRQNVRS